MEKILKEASVTPKVTLTQDEYNRLVSLARAAPTRCNHPTVSLAN